jgi:hypothetical protein
MSNSVHIFYKKALKRHKKDVFEYGTPVVTPTSMNQKITYRQLSLLAGIAVAVFIAFTLWFSQASEPIGGISAKKLKPVSLKSMGHTPVKKGYSILKVY